jgi:hypothetical protein
LNGTLSDFLNNMQNILFVGESNIII